MIGTPPIQESIPVENDMVSFLRAKGWPTWFTQAFNILFAVQQSGVTADRPTRNLWAGRTYFDVTLGKPIWWDAVAEEWIDATGAAA